MRIINLDPKRPWIWCKRVGLFDKLLANNPRLATNGDSTCTRNLYCVFPIRKPAAWFHRCAAIGDYIIELIVVTDIKYQGSSGAINAHSCGNLGDVWWYSHIIVVNSNAKNLVVFWYYRISKNISKINILCRNNAVWLELKHPGAVNIRYCAAPLA